MVFPALEFLVGAHVRIAVIEVGDQPDIDLVILGVVHKSTTTSATPIERPAQAVYYQAFLVFFRGYFPDLLDANAVVLGVFARIQREFVDQLLAQVAAATLGKQGVFRVQFHARM